MNNGGWRVTVPVPRELVKTVGKTRLKRSLDTHSQAEAERRKHAVVAEFLAMIEAARQGRLPKAAVTGISASSEMSDKELTKLALDLRSNLQAQEEKTPALGHVDKVDSQISGSVIQDCLLGGSFGARRPDGYGMADH
jgi:hypothetical protein